MFDKFLWSRTQEFDLHTTSCMQLVLDKDFYESVAIKILAYSWWASSVCTVIFFYHMLSYCLSAIQIWGYCPKGKILLKTSIVIEITAKIPYSREYNMCWEVVWTLIVYRLWIGQFEFNVIAKKRWNSVKLFVEIFTTKTLHETIKGLS